jgi:hypothetical protein
MDKVILRDLLFQTYFDNNGVSVKDLNDKLSFVLDTWNKLRDLCKENIRFFDRYGSLEKFKIIEHNNKNYLVLKLRIWKYVIIDLDNIRNITRDEFYNDFDVDFFVKYFGEVSDEFGLDIYQVKKYNGEVQELVDFYYENENIFELNAELHHICYVDDAWTWLLVDYANGRVQMGFQTFDQTLYEQLFLNYDLSPYGMQDAIGKMGIDKMNEIFSKIGDIIIPSDSIPSDLYEQYLINCNQIKKKL